MDRTVQPELTEDVVPAGVPTSNALRLEPGWFTPFFHDVFPKLHRFLSRYTGDPDLASETAQEAFIRLYRQRHAPNDPEAWVFTVSLNLVRNLQAKRSRRQRLLTRERSIGVLSDPPPLPGATAEGGDVAAHVRRAMAELSDRERRLLLLRAEGYSYRELGQVLAIKESSVGTMLKRAKQAFLDAYQGKTDAP